MKVSPSKYAHINWNVVPLLFLFSIVLLITAWLSDDAYITLKTVDNFINGFGLTWNVSERVQAFTHPLWALLLAAFQYVTREAYFTSIVLSMLISLIAFYILISKLSISGTNSIIIGLILISSKTFADYSTSGLENPLSHLLTVLFFALYFSSALNKNKLFFLAFISSLAVLSRLDLLVIFLPVLLSRYFNNAGKLKNIMLLLAGFIPLFAWELFSLFYYGFLFPNTAYAKLNTGIGKIDLIEQGLLYLLDSLYMDPLTFFTLLFVIPITFIKGNKELLPIALGVFLNIIYIVAVGGDFMSGRFLSVPLLCSVVIFSRIKIQFGKSFAIFVLMIVALGFISPRPNLLSTPSYA